MTIGGHWVVPKPSVRNLGVILDSGLTMQAQVAHIAKSCYHQIRNIGQIRSSITDDVCKTLVLHASTTRMRCYVAFRRQRCSVCNDHIMPVLQHQHWLPICVHPTYKVFLFAYSGMHDQALCYLMELLSRCQPNHRLRSVSLPLLTLPALQTVTRGDRRFAVAAAALWNGLPDSVRMAKTQTQHKTLLKMHLFKLVFLWRDHVDFNYIHLSISYTIYIT